MILALDLGTTTGYAVADMHGAVILSGVWRLPKARPEQAYSRLASVIEEALKFWPPHDTRAIDYLAYEDVPAQAHSGGDAAHRWGGFEAVTLVACARDKVRYIRVKPATWKRAAGLNAGTNDKDALAAARVRWPGYEFATPDEAVARWIAVAAAGRIE